MRLVKVITLSVILALIVYSIFTKIRTRKTIISPLPEDGIKIIQLTPTK